MPKPDLKIIDHPDKDRSINLMVIDYGWGKITLEHCEGPLDNKTALWLIEQAKLDVMLERS